MAPELFHLLPDLQSPGSILGDGGFAGTAKLPRRRLEEYENIVPLTNCGIFSISNATATTGGTTGSTSNTSGTSEKAVQQRIRTDSVDIIAGTSVSSRHVLLKATYDGEDVVLKGFIMSEKGQRKGLECELAILGRLRNDSVILPVALVEDSGGFEGGGSGSFLNQVAVFIEYPYYKGGNLSSWLKITERKPWELQGVARQLLYGLLYLHDHGVIHRVSSSTCVHE